MSDASGFDEYLKSTCDPARMSLFKPHVRSMCERLLHHEGHGRRLVETYGDRNDLGLLMPGTKLDVGRVPPMKWRVCGEFLPVCRRDEFHHMLTLSDSCGLCRMIATDLLYLTRRGHAAGYAPLP